MWRYLGITAATLLGTAIVYWLIGADPVEVNEQETVIVTEPDVYAEAVLFKQLRPDGSLYYQLHAAAIQQHDHERITRLSAPQLHLLNPDQPPWDIGARYGYIRQRSGAQGKPEEVVYLRDSVEMVQIHPTNGQMTIRSETFYVYPDHQYAETNHNVMIDSEVGRTKAAGLRADLRTGLLSLSSNNGQRVHTIVLPEQFKQPQDAQRSP